jgi:hypothetical protein
MYQAHQKKDDTRDSYPSRSHQSGELEHVDEPLKEEAQPLATRDTTLDI